MSALGKVFLVINLVLALIFLGTSATLFSTRSRWRDEAEDVKAKMEGEAEKYVEEANALKSALDQLGEQLRAMQTHNVKLTTDASSLRQESARLTTEVADAKTETVRLNSLLTEKEGVVKQQGGQVSKLQDQVTALTEQAKNAMSEMEKAVAERDRMALDLDGTKGELHKTLTELEDVKRGKADLEAYVEAIRREVPDVPASPDMVPKIDAKIFAVKRDQNLVVLTVGQDDKVREGYPFSVFRGGEYIGKVKVIEVLGDISGARIEFTVPGKEIREGDNATTRL
ncbi:MAG: hypothetical protein JXP34_22675 [Planctomycetes bacterium]|nr:hypothetical protein [Planctomycetota bacterium]